MPAPNACTIQLGEILENSRKLLINSPKMRFEDVVEKARKFIFKYTTVENIARSCVNLLFLAENRK